MPTSVSWAGPRRLRAVNSPPGPLAVFPHRASANTVVGGRPQASSVLRNHPGVFLLLHQSQLWVSENRRTPALSRPVLWGGQVGPGHPAWVSGRMCSRLLCPNPVNPCGGVWVPGTLCSSVTVPFLPWVHASHSTEALVAVSELSPPEGLHPVTLRGCVRSALRACVAVALPVGPRGAVSRGPPAVLARPVPCGSFGTCSPSSGFPRRVAGSCCTPGGHCPGARGAPRRWCRPCAPSARAESRASACRVVHAAQHHGVLAGARREDRRPGVQVRGAGGALQSLLQNGGCRWAGHPFLRAGRVLSPAAPTTCASLGMFRASRPRAPGLSTVALREQEQVEACPCPSRCPTGGQRLRPGPAPSPLPSAGTQLSSGSSQPWRVVPSHSRLSLPVSGTVLGLGPSTHLHLGGRWPAGRGCLSRTRGLVATPCSLARPLETWRATGGRPQPAVRACLPGSLPSREVGAHAQVVCPLGFRFLSRSVPWSPELPLLYAPR